MNKQFKEWVVENLDIGTLNHTTLFGHTGQLDFDQLPFSMQWGVYLEFFHSVDKEIIQRMLTYVGYWTFHHDEELKFAQQQAVEMEFKKLEND